MSDSPKTLLMISYPFPPNSSAGAIRSERFARYLPKFGWAVDVVTIKARRDMFGDTARLKNLGENVKVHFTDTVDPWLWLRERKPGNLFARGIRSFLMDVFCFPDHMLLWVPFAVRKGLGICKEKEIDAIYSTSPPHSTHLAAMIISSLTHKPWVADYRDPWSFRPDFYRQQSSYLKKLEKWLDHRVLKSADFIVFNTFTAKNKLRQIFKDVGENKVICITNGWEDFTTTEAYDLTGKDFRILHTGTFYPRFKPYALLYGIARWRENLQPKGIPPLKNLRIIMLGSRDDETRRVVSTLKLMDIVDILPWASLDEARLAMERAHLLWTSLGSREEAALSLPSKVFEYIAARRPILGFFPEGDASSLIQSTGTGVVVSSDEPEGIIRTIYSAMTLREQGKVPFYSPKYDVINSFRIDVITEKLASGLDEIISTR